MFTAINTYIFTHQISEIKKSHSETMLYFKCFAYLLFYKFLKSGKYNETVHCGH